MLPVNTGPVVALSAIPYTRSITARPGCAGREQRNMGIGKNATIGLATSLLVFGLGILISVVLTRQFGPDQRGVYVILVTTNTLLASMAALSVGLAVGPVLAQRRHGLAEVHTAVLVLAGLLGAAGLIIATVAFLVLRESVFHNVSYT